MEKGLYPHFPNEVPYNKSEADDSEVINKLENIICERVNIEKTGEHFLIIMINFSFCHNIFKMPQKGLSLMKDFKNGSGIPPLGTMLQ